MQKTLVLIKPDGVRRGLSGEILSRFEKRGLRIAALKMIWMDKDLAERHYAVHREKPFFASLVSFITSGPVVAAVIEGREAVEVVRRMMGETDPIKSAPGTIRGDFGMELEENLIHGSDSVENALQETANFFDEKEIIAQKA